MLYPNSRDLWLQMLMLPQTLVEEIWTYSIFRIIIRFEIICWGPQNSPRLFCVRPTAALWMFPYSTSFLLLIIYLKAIVYGGSYECCRNIVRLALAALTYFLTTVVRHVYVNMQHSQPSTSLVRHSLYYCVVNPPNRTVITNRRNVSCMAIIESMGAKRRNSKESQRHNWQVWWTEANQSL